MFFDDIELVKAMTVKYPHADGPIVDIGGLPRPCVANYTKTIEAMKELYATTFASEADRQKAVTAAQVCRYEDIEWPLSFLGNYEVENPELAGGLPIERLHERFPRTIGLAICLSVLEHVDQPWFVEDDLHRACAPGALLIVSVPWMFPWHGTPDLFPDHFRFSPSGLRQLFKDETLWEVLEAEWRLDIPASAGVFNIQNGQPQATQTAYLVARCL